MAEIVVEIKTQDRAQHLFDDKNFIESHLEGNWLEGVGPKTPMAEGGTP